VDLCVWAALASLLVTAIIPVLFFQFPGPKFMPFRYESMWAVTEVLWGPLRMLQTGLTPLLGSGLRQNVNPYYVAPLVNAPMAFVAVCSFLILRNARRKRARDAGAPPDLRSVAGRVEEIRTNYPAALREVPHPAPHAETDMLHARAKAEKQPFFQREPEPEAPGKDDENASGAEQRD
jgi:hypothetical protein